MKLANHDGRLSLVVAGGVIDVHAASDGRFGPDPAAAYDRWEELRAWAADATGDVAPLDEAKLGAPSPAPRQVFAIGLNYASHAAESGMDLARDARGVHQVPGFAGRSVRPHRAVGRDGRLGGGAGRGDGSARRLASARSMPGVTSPDCASARTSRTGPCSSPRPRGFYARQARTDSYGPTVPGRLATPGELADPDDLALGCSIDGVTVQEDRTSGLVFDVSRIIAEISAVVPMLPGDLIFTGTPAGVGITSKPPRFLKEGEVIESWIEGLGTIRNRAVFPQAVDAAIEGVARRTPRTSSSSATCASRSRTYRR